MTMTTETSSMNYLITGAARGIGRGLSRHLLSKSHRLYLLDSNSSELSHTIKLLTSQLSTQSPPLDPAKYIKSTVIDLTNRSQIIEAIKDVSSFFEGKLDVLINNAAATPHIWSNDETIEDANLEDILQQWDQKISVGLTAPFILSTLCIPLLKSPSYHLSSSTSSSKERRPGTIINISSTRAHQSEPNHEAYSTTKAGLLGLTQSLAVSLGTRHGIRINSISPGWINVMDESKEADENSIKWSDGLTEQDHGWHLNKRVGRVEDIVKTVEYLVDNDFISGEEIVVDGGVRRRMVYPE